MQGDARTRRGSQPGGLPDIEAAIAEVYARHAPERVASVGKLLAQHAGREQQLLQKILAKYRPARDARRREGCGSAPPPLPPQLQPQSPAASLPAEVLSLCMRQLQSAGDAGRCACVCRAWRAAVDDQILWGRLYFAAGPSTVEDDVANRGAATGSWRARFKQRCARQAHARLGKVLARVQKIGALKPRHGVADSFNPGSTFNSMRQITDALGLSFTVAVNGGTPRLASALGVTQRGDVTKSPKRPSLSLSLRCDDGAIRVAATVRRHLPPSFAARLRL